MFRGLYAAATGMVAATERQEQTAHNLSHLATPGYRQRGATFETFDRELGRAVEATGDVVGTKFVAAYHDFRPGPVVQTGAPLDLALGDADTFFRLAGPDGPLLSRNGTFQLDGQGRIVSQGGYPVEGEGGPIVVPAGTANVSIGSDGGVAADGVPVGRIQLVRATDPRRLTAVGPTLYAAPPEAGVQAATGRVVQGYREGSNVDPAGSMVRMIADTRYYEAAQRALRTIGESVQLNTRPQG
jgi:flagellar basal body rod protein FlgG